LAATLIIEEHRELACTSDRLMNRPAQLRDGSRHLSLKVWILSQYGCEEC